MSEHSSKTYLPHLISFFCFVAGDDFVPLEDDVMLVRGDEECFDIPTIDDDVVEPSESFMVLLSNANGVTIVDGTVSIRIADNGDCKYKLIKTHTMGHILVHLFLLPTQCLV